MARDWSVEHIRMCPACRRLFFHSYWYEYGGGVSPSEDGGCLHRTTLEAALDHVVAGEWSGNRKWIWI